MKRLSPVALGFSIALLHTYFAIAPKADEPINSDATDRFGGPLLVTDVFPTALNPLHPLNPADLSRSSESVLQFGIQQKGKSLTLGLPNFLFAIADQEIEIEDSGGLVDTYDAKKYELGYGLSSTDLGLGHTEGLSAAIGFHIRYITFKSQNNTNQEKANWAYPDMGASVWYKRLRIDGAVLNVTRLVEADKELPGHQPREFNVGLAYGLPNDWLAFGRIGIQDTSSNQTLVDVGFEKMFFESLTFRVGTQRRYASQKGESAEESRSSLSGGLEYRLGAFGKGYRYPEKDADLFSQQTLVRIFHNTQVGMNVTLTRVPGNANHTSNDNTSLIVTLGKAF